jgi:8-oxo-dGTP diphosphatase
MTETPRIAQLKDTAVDETKFTRRFADCLVLTHDNRILLNRRTDPKHSGNLTAFGGHIEPGEHHRQAMIRELNEELGTKIEAADAIFIGAITEEITQHTEIVYTYFWHDKAGTVTGCYEGEAAYYERVEDALADPKIMDYLRWLLLECRKRGLLA